MTFTGSTRYQLKDNGEYLISDYNSTKLFSSFFPGVAGQNGIPMWLFYVNRGQCVCSMGIEDKQHPIMEFLPANRAYQLVTSQGFRTFIKLNDHPTLNFYEPFQDHLRDREVERTQRMYISPASLRLEEVNETLGLKFSVEYFNVPQDRYAGLVRILNIENLNRDTITLSGLDGLPLIIPYGVDNNMLKQMRRLVEAFVEVSNFDQGVPFFRGKVEPADRPDVIRIIKGNFYLGFESCGTEPQLIKPIVDPQKIFGNRSDYSYPERFLTDTAAEMSSGQILENRLPSAMGRFDTTLAPGAVFKYVSIIGHAHSTEELNALVPKLTSNEYIESKERENRETIDSLTQPGFICSREAVLDQYARQNFLDNTLRGGLPQTLTGKRHSTTLHFYSRKHGDLERDYNDFRLAPTPFSQGNGNFRDVNQNRRSDLLFNPDVGAENVEQFCNLIQLDGFNPLVVKETGFRLKDKQKLNELLANHLAPEQLRRVVPLLEAPFTPGELAINMKELGIEPQQGLEQLFGDLLGSCERLTTTEHGEGFWTDHWTYNLDLLENFLAIYPEQKSYLLFEKSSFTFYDNPHRVQPRDEKYVLWEGHPMQLEAVVYDEEKGELLNQRVNNHDLVHTARGQGEVYYTTLFNKFLCLLVNKMASLDPSGVGVEMEADKPNWYDALNGLPGLIGSSISETLEIKRHILFLQKALAEEKTAPATWPVFTELYQFMQKLQQLLQQELSQYEFWDQATAAKESYRADTRLGISGEEQELTVAEVQSFFTACLEKLDAGIARAWNEEEQVISTYFINQVTRYHELEETAQDGTRQPQRNRKGMTRFRAEELTQKALPLFLEGPVHYLRCHPDHTRAADLVASISRSGLYDQRLGMYKVNASLAEQPMEIGRARIFSPGWFENESIWLHMEYKYMLEMLRNGLHDQFYQDFKQVFVPFFDPETYGRSILENSSFIVSSGNPDPDLHGNGFVARLSGATAEFIQILQLMSVGEQPFQLNGEGELVLKLRPALPEWLFTREERTERLLLQGEWQEITFPPGSFSFMFLGSVLVTYHNPERRDTFGDRAVRPLSWEVTDREGQTHFLTGDRLQGELVRQVRNRKISRMEIKLS